MLQTHTKPPVYQPVSVEAQQGAVLTEFIVISGMVLIGLFLLMPFIGKLIDTRQKVEVSGRYMAWERSVWYDNVPSFQPNKANHKSLTEINNEIHQRIFAKHDAPVFSNQKSTVKGVDYDVLQNYQFRPKGQYDTLLVKKGGDKKAPKYITTTQSEHGNPSSLIKVGDFILNLAADLGDFDLNTKGYFKGQVSTSIKNLTWFSEFAKLDLTMSTHSAILTDSWNAGGADHIETRVKGLLPQALLDFKGLKKMQDIVGIVPIFEEIKSDSLMLGHVTSEPVPAHRLAKYK